LTRELIKAEEEFAAVKAKAVALGVPVIGSDQSSGFVSNGEDGAGSGEMVPSERINKPSIEKWLDEVLEKDDDAEWEKLPSPRSASGEEWEFKEVEVHDSGSAVAEGNERRRIDKWRRMCEAITLE
jgi:glycosyltransferase involved in cell wall biosynthesis